MPSRDIEVLTQIVVMRSSGDAQVKAQITPGGARTQRDTEICQVNVSGFLLTLM